MSYGLRITNPSGHLVLSSDARGLYCIGKAVQQSLVQSSGDPLTTGGKSSGKSVYRISHGGPILVALDLPNNTYVAATVINEVSSGVWDITVLHGSTLDSETLIATQESLDVWAFGTPVSNTPYAAYGLAIYDAAGNLAWDLSQPNPLFIRDFITHAPTLVAQEFTIPSLTRPVILAVPYARQTLDTRAVNTHTVTDRTGALYRSGTSLTTLLIGTKRSRYLSPEDGEQVDDPGCICSFILEGASLP